MKPKPPLSNRAKRVIITVVEALRSKYSDVRRLRGDSPDSDLIGAAKYVLREYKTRYIYTHFLKQEECGATTAREVCVALGVPRQPWVPPKKKWAPPRRPWRAPAPAPLPPPPLKERFLSARALKVLTCYMTGRTGTRIDADDRLICTMAALLDPPVDARDLELAPGCGPRTLVEIRAALQKFAPEVVKAPEYNHFTVTFDVRAVRQVEHRMIIALRRSLDHMLATPPISNALVVRGAAVTKVSP